LEQYFSLPPRRLQKKKTQKESLSKKEGEKGGEPSYEERVAGSLKPILLFNEVA